MRAYVLTEKTGTDLKSSMTLGVVSSRKAAIHGCEQIFNTTGTDGDITWEQKDKHVGRVTKNGRVLTYKMFFINRIEE